MITSPLKSPLSNNSSNLKIPPLPIDILQRILSPEFFTRKQALGIPLVCRDYYMLGQKLIWQELNVVLGDAIIHSQQEAFLDQPKFRPFVRSLQVTLQLGPPGTSDTQPLGRIDRIFDSLDIILARLYPLNQFGLFVNGYKNSERKALHNWIRKPLYADIDITHLSLEQDRDEIRLFDVPNSCHFLNYFELRISKNSDFAIMQQLILPEIYTLSICNLTKDLSFTTLSIMNATFENNLRTLILKGLTKSVISVLGQVRTCLLNLERIELQFTDTIEVREAQPHCSKVLDGLASSLPFAPKLKELCFGPVFYSWNAVRFPFDRMFWESPGFWSNLLVSTKLVVRFDHLLEQEGTPFVAREELRERLAKNGNEFGVHMIGESGLFPFSQT